MDQLEEILAFAFAILILLFGLVLVIGGLRIIRAKNYLAVSKSTPPHRWKPPQLVKGRSSIFVGAQYIFGGTLFILFAVFVIYALLK